MSSQDVDRWESDLLAAGWTRKGITIWQAPNGALFRGPFGAWCAMRQAGEPRICPNCQSTLVNEGHFVPPSLGEPGFFICADAALTPGGTGGGDRG